jgi:uncharacterized membrane protein
VQPNGDLFVEERIDIDFEKRRHGIYRTIPVHYTDRFGVGYSFKLSHIEVTDGSGRPHLKRVRREGRYINVRIGDPDRTVLGEVLYVIRYRVRGALRHFPEYDELYWNATGHEWNARIREASVAVHLPAEFSADSLAVLAYTGTVGSREESAEITMVQPDVVLFDVTRPLRAREGVTVIVAWPLGYVAAPGAVRRFAALGAENWILVVPFFVLLILWRVYRTSGRDPGARSIAVQYEPPPGMSPGGIGTVIDERVDTRDITATIVDLAVRGFLTIETEELSEMWGLKKRDVTVFERNKRPADGELLAHEIAVLDALFKSGSRVTTHDLREQFYRSVPGIKNDLYARLSRMNLFAANPHAQRSKYVAGGFVAGALVFGVGAAWAFWRGGILPHALLIPGISCIATVILFAAFSPAMPRRTRKGVRMRSWALGFQEFAQRVEKPRLEALEARQVFERLLPYAIALGVSSNWARRFEDIYSEESPRWYVGSHHGAWISAHAFESSLSDAMSTAEQSILTSPRSSGSGGGGFSGGGGGGGGVVAAPGETGGQAARYGAHSCGDAPAAVS